MNENVTLKVKSHYKDVANEVLDALDDDAVVGRSACCEAPQTGSEASFLYGLRELGEMPEGAKAASRGCGDPIAKADLTPSERVLDLGCGGGIDALIASKIVGEGGKVYGVDMTDEMIDLATKNAADANCDNVEFLKGMIEDIPLPDSCVDVVISNCVINLCEHKEDAFKEAYRLLAPGGRLVISDIVAFAPVPHDIEEPYCKLTGCANGVKLDGEYASMLEEAGFCNVSIEPKTVYTLEVLKEKATRKNRMDSFKKLEGRLDVDGKTGSAIISAHKPD